MIFLKIQSSKTKVAKMDTKDFIKKQKQNKTTTTNKQKPKNEKQIKKKQLTEWKDNLLDIRK